MRQQNHQRQERKTICLNMTNIVTVRCQCLLIQADMFDQHRVMITITDESGVAEE